MRTGTIETPAGITASEEVVLTAMTNLNNGRIRETIASFAEEFSFKDHGLGLDFTDKARLAEFFEKTREFYPDSFVQVDAIFGSGDLVNRRMDPSSHVDRAVLRRALQERSDLASRRVHCADRRLQDYKLV